MMHRREFVTTFSSLVASTSIAGCLSDLDGKTGAKETLVREVPSADSDEEDVPVGVTPTESERIALRDIRFQPAGQQGVLVAGDVTNQSDRSFEDFYIEVTLYDQNETADNVLDTESILKEHDGFEPGQTWQWAATFPRDPMFDITYYSVTAVGEFD